MTLPRPRIPIDEPVPLESQGSWPDSVHVFDEHSAWAIESALQACRPLLVRGETGTGKSQLARAAALKLERAFIAEVVHARSESQDLLYRYDAVGRLGEAHTLRRAMRAEIDARLDPLKYLTPGPLWWAINPGTARDRQAAAHKTCAGQAVPDQDYSNGCVLLIDEMDKADSDLPNGLLEALGNGGFSVPWLPDAVRADPAIPAPLVIVTSNEEKELPAAFVRRCMVLNLRLPKDEAEFVPFMERRGRHHFGTQCSDDVYTEAARLLWADRQKADNLGHPVPGQAEYLDLLRVLVKLSEGDHAVQDGLLKKVAGFALKKHPDLAD